MARPNATTSGEDAETDFHAPNHLPADDFRLRKQSGEAATADTFVLT